jgi:hypothetical protein
MGAVRAQGGLQGKNGRRSRHNWGSSVRLTDQPTGLGVPGDPEAPALESNDPARGNGPGPVLTESAIANAAHSEPRSHE